MEKPYGSPPVSKLISKDYFLHLFLRCLHMTIMFICSIYILYSTIFIQYIIVPLYSFFPVFANPSQIHFFELLFIIKVIIDNLIVIIFHICIYVCVNRYSLLILFTVACTYRSLGLTTWNWITYPIQGSFVEKTCSPSLDNHYFSIALYLKVKTSEMTTLMLNKVVLSAFILQETETTIKFHNWSKCREQLAMGFPSQQDTSLIQHCT